MDSVCVVIYDRACGTIQTARKEDSPIFPGGLILEGERFASGSSGCNPTSLRAGGVKRLRYCLKWSR